MLTELSAFTAEKGIDMEMTLFQWFFTIFVEAAPTDVALRVWDMFLLDGNEVCVCVCVCVCDS